MTPAVILYRLGTLVAEGYTTLAEAESLAVSRPVFEGWLTQRWNARNRADIQRLNANAPARVVLSDEMRKRIVEHIRNRYGSYAEYQASEQGKAAARYADEIAEKYRIKSAKEVAAWWREKREK